MEDEGRRPQVAGRRLTNNGGLLPDYADHGLALLRFGLLHPGSRSRASETRYPSAADPARYRARTLTASPRPAPGRPSKKIRTSITITPTMEIQAL